jgi:hypothetical protein
MGDWRMTFHELIEQTGATPSVVYNADQTGLYHTKLPNRLYVDKSQQKDYAGVKQMKSKDRLTLMGCTSATGKKVPLSIIGKAKKPECFCLCNNDTPPMAYNNQMHGSIGQLLCGGSTMCSGHIIAGLMGAVVCFLLLDNCSAHKIDGKDIHACET